MFCNRDRQVVVVVSLLNSSSMHSCVFTCTLCISLCPRDLDVFVYVKEMFYVLFILYYDA